MAVKEYTTPTLKIRLKNADYILSNAKTVIVSARRNSVLIDKTPDIVDDVLYVKFTEEETGNLKGDVTVEVTIETTDGVIIKSNTISLKVEQSVRRKALA